MQYFAFKKLFFSFCFFFPLAINRLKTFGNNFHYFTSLASFWQNLGEGSSAREAVPSSRVATTPSASQPCWQGTPRNSAVHREMGFM